MRTGGRMRKKVFLSYRRDDSSGYTQRLHDELSRHYGPTAVFIDVHKIRPLDRFKDVIDHAIKETGILFVVMSKQWSSIANTQGSRRILDPDDIVAQPGHAGRVNGAQITATDDRYFHWFSHQVPAMTEQASLRTLQDHSRHIPPGSRYRLMTSGNITATAGAAQHNPPVSAWTRMSTAPGVSCSHDRQQFCSIVRQVVVGYLTGTVCFDRLHVGAEILQLHVLRGPTLTRTFLSRKPMGDGRHWG